MLQKYIKSWILTLEKEPSKIWTSLKSFAFILKLTRLAASGRRRRTRFSQPSGSSARNISRTLLIRSAPRAYVRISLRLPLIKISVSAAAFVLKTVLFQPFIKPITLLRVISFRLMKLIPISASSAAYVWQTVSLAQ